MPHPFEAFSSWSRRIGTKCTVRGRSVSRSAGTVEGCIRGLMGDGGNGVLGIGAAWEFTRPLSVAINYHGALRRLRVPNQPRASMVGHGVCV